MSDEFKPLEISPLAHRMHNPIRALVDQMVLDPNPKLEYIRLSLGDPTVYGNYPIHNHVNQSVMNAISSGDFNGYGPAHGLESARRAVAEYCSTDTIKLTADDCFITNGASGAIEIAILTFCSKTKKLYIPSPGFILYKALCVVYDIPYEFYKCDPNNNWEIDLQDLENKMKTSEVEPGMILICNPSNPTGSCFSRQHLTDICDLAGKYSLPILADEIYSNMNFEGKFTWTAECSKKSPVISVGGIAKRYLAPGWRLGWFTLNDKSNALTPFIRNKCTTMCQRILGPNGPLQGALPEILLKTPSEYYTKLNSDLKSAATEFHNGLLPAKGLKPIMPGGAMYLMVAIDLEKFPKYKNDLEFCNDMVTQQAVFCLPGSIFDLQNSFRIVITVPKECIEVATSRIVQFCEDNYMKN